MATTDTNVPQVIVNKLTSAEYATATKSPTEFYAVTDGQIETADIADGAVTTAKLASPKVIAKGTVTIGNIAPSTNIERTVNIGVTMPNNTYQVLVQKNADGSYWSFVEYGVHTKTTTSFGVTGWSTASGTATDCTFDWVVIG